MPVPPAYTSYANPWAMPYHGEMAYPGAMPYGYARPPVWPAPGADPYAQQMSREQELDFLRNEAEAMKEELDQIDARIKELETD
jgi:hypothetical protein